VESRKQTTIQQNKQRKGLVLALASARTEVLMADNTRCQHWGDYCPYENKCGWMKQCDNCKANHQDRCRRYSSTSYALKRWIEESWIGRLIRRFT
jgi:hypothetical protein